jgi:mono/diheme cytochrome c family protein
MIRLWINMGARNTSNCKSCDTTSFEYSTRVKGIIQNWCVGCHSSNNSSGGIDLSDYNGIIKTIPNNKLLGSIKHMPGIIAMPQTGGQLSSCEITAIEKWINNGYPNN